jgi:hypothetical protein
VNSSSRLSIGPSHPHVEKSLIIFNCSKFPAAALDQFVINCKLEKSDPRVQRAAVVGLITVLGAGIHATISDKDIATLSQAAVVAGGQF